MATYSIKKNIVIRDKDSAAAFVSALEQAALLAAKPAGPSGRVKELKGAEEIKAFFGEKIR